MRSCHEPGTSSGPSYYDNPAYVYISIIGLLCGVGCAYDLLWLQAFVVIVIPGSDA